MPPQPVGFVHQYTTTRLPAASWRDKPREGMMTVPKRIGTYNVVSITSRRRSNYQMAVQVHPGARVAWTVAAAIVAPRKINDVDMFGRLVLATIAGACIGFERR